MAYSVHDIQCFYIHSHAYVRMHQSPLPYKPVTLQPLNGTSVQRRITTEQSILKLLHRKVMLGVNLSVLTLSKRTVGPDAFPSSVNHLGCDTIAGLPTEAGRVVLLLSSPASTVAGLHAACERFPPLV